MEDEVKKNPVGRPAMFESAESLENAIQAYFDIQIEKALPITISGLAYALGFISRQSLYDYKEKEEFSYILKRATFFVESQYEAKLSANNPTGSIFALKNMGWKDSHSTELTGANGSPLPTPTFIFQAAPSCKPVENDPGNTAS